MGAFHCGMWIRFCSTYCAILRIQRVNQIIRQFTLPVVMSRKNG